MTSFLISAGDSLDMGRAKKWRRIFNQLSYRLTFSCAKDETTAAGKGAPLTPSSAPTSTGGGA